MLTIFFTGNFAVLPLRTRTRGPAYTLPPLPAGTSDLEVDPDSESYDALDEVLTLFRANTFFRNFEIRGPADRLLIYGILFVSDCLTKIKPGMSSREAEKVLQAFLSLMYSTTVVQEESLVNIHLCNGWKHQGN